MISNHVEDHRFQSPSKEFSSNQCNRNDYRFESPAPALVLPQHKVIDGTSDNLLNSPINRSSTKKQLSIRKEQRSLMHRFWKCIDSIGFLRRSRSRTSSKYLRKKSMVHSDHQVDIEEAKNSSKAVECGGAFPVLSRANTQDMSLMASPVNQSTESTIHKFSLRLSMSHGSFAGELSSRGGSICNIGTLMQNIETSIRQSYHHSIIRIDWMLAYQDEYLTAIHSTYPMILDYAIRKTINSLSHAWKHIAVFVCFRRHIHLNDGSRSELETSMKKQGVKGKICVTFRYSDPRSVRELVSFVDPILVNYEDAISRLELKADESDDMVMSLVKLVEGGGQNLDFQGDMSSKSKFESFGKVQQKAAIGVKDMLPSQSLILNHGSTVELWIPSTARLYVNQGGI
jgi:hypothetical protein